eukprot:Colp12_sorted_trinity150504_noHs@28880
METERPYLLFKDPVFEDLTARANLLHHHDMTDTFLSFASSNINESTADCIKDLPAFENVKATDASLAQLLAQPPIGGLAFTPFANSTLQAAFKLQPGPVDLGNQLEPTSSHKRPAPAETTISFAGLDHGGQPAKKHKKKDKKADGDKKKKKNKEKDKKEKKDKDKDRHTHVHPQAPS